MFGYWPEIMEHIHMIGLKVNTIFDEKSILSYLYTYLSARSESIGTEIGAADCNVSGNALGIDGSK